MSALLKRLLKDRDNGYLFNAIRRHRLKKQEQKKSQWKWEGKVYPSALSFDMCVAEHFANIENFVEFGIDALYTMSDGTAKHTELQTDAAEIEGLLYPPPTFPTEELKVKYLSIRPEVPIYDEATKISGRADLILNVKDKPVPIDIKTCSVDPAAWAKDWQKTIPLEKHKCQVSIYGHNMNDNNYYPVKAEEAGLAYVNKLMKPGSQGSEKEYYFPLSETREKYLALMMEIALHMQAKMSGKVAPCTYMYCKQHSDGSHKIVVSKS